MSSSSPNHHQLHQHQHHHQQQQQQQQQPPMMTTTATTTTGSSSSISNHNNPRPPRLCRDLELALATLYSLPLRSRGLQQQQQNHHDYSLSHQKEAHEYLVHIQSRNIRRKIQSLKQRQQSKQQQQSAALSSSSSPRSVEMGSSWLACLYVLLCQSEAPPSDTERLFCAQTLLHRLRRTKINESVDFEVERDVDMNENEALQLYETTPCQYLQTMVPTYQHWIRTMNPFVGSVVDTYNTYNCSSSSADNIHSTAAAVVLLQSNDEERIKGDLSLLTLAAIAYSTAVSIATDNNNCNIVTITSSPLLSTVAESLATLALRVRYNQHTAAQQSSQYHHQQHNGSSSSKTESSTQHHQPRPIVTLVAHSFAVVWETVIEIQYHNNPGTAAAAAAAATNNSNIIPPVNRLAFGAALHACLGAIPDTLLGGVGGARGRLSIDPRCLQTANQEVRAIGLTLLAETMQQFAASGNHQQSSDEESCLDLCTLKTLCRWAKNLPIPSEFVPLINKYVSSESPHHQQAALACVIAICEGGAWTVQEVLSYSLGLHDQQLVQQPNKKRQTSKSRKRHKDLLENGTTESLLANVHNEVHQRGEIACKTILMVWNGLVESVKHALAVSRADPQSEVHGEGPIGCLCSAANACLPHIVRYPLYIHARELFQAIVVPFQEVCRSGNKTARALAYEPLYTLHTAIVETVRTSGPLDDSFESLVVDHFFECCMGLAAACSYPRGYFDDLAANSDEELEIERNDVRDLLRVVAGSGEGGSTSDVQSAGDPIGMSLKLLAKLLHACEQSILASRQHHQLFEETIIHALSALARPLNHLAKSINTGAPAGSVDVLLLATRVLQLANEDLIAAFSHSFSAADLLPRSRVANIAMASLTPMIAVLCTAAHAETQQIMAKAVDVFVQAAATSIVRLPELAARTALGSNQYGIRGAMRGPGGEDHVGCLSFMRLVFESDNLARFVVHSSPQVIPRLCQIYKEMKMIETERGQGVFHGCGVTPQSGRILLNVLCYIEFLSEGQGQAGALLNELFRSTVAAVSSFRSCSPLDEQAFYQLCEAGFDIGSFSPHAVRSLFKAEGGTTGAQDKVCLEVLTSGCLEGYRRLSTADPPDGVTIQWNRLRAAVFNLLKISADPDISPLAAEIILAIIKTECEAIHHQCSAGPASGSSLFHDKIVSADSIPAGLFVRALGEVLAASNSPGLPLEGLQQCILTLHSSRNFVLSTILLTCSDPLTGAFADPRPTLAEAWFFSMIQVAKVSGRGATNIMVEDLLTDTVLGVVTLLFYPIVLGKSTFERKRSAPGFSFDGPQSLALTDFLTHFFALGPAFLEKLAVRLIQQVPVEFGSNLQALDSRLRGVAILGAALFRGSLGGLPPWAVESAPDIYSALYMAINKDPASFRLLLQLSLHLRLSPSAPVGIGSVQPGELLCGRYFETISDQVKDRFIQEATELCIKDDTTSWRRLKVLIKQISGGKKKDTHFGQKPTMTAWELERI